MSVLNEQQARRVQKLMKINMKAEQPPELIFKFANDSILLDNRINGLSDKEAIDVLIAKEEREAMSVGVMYHVLTCGDNQELFIRMIRYINGGGVEYWHTILCNMNMALYECWPYLHFPCKEQLIKLLREGIRQNVKQIENIVMSAFRTIMSSSDYVTKTRILTYLVTTIREFEGWFKALRGQSMSAVVCSMLNCVSHVLSASQAPLSKEDTFRENMVNFLHWIIKNRKLDCQALGRDFILILIKLGKLPQIEDIWRDLVQNPNSYGVSGLEEYMAKPNMFQHLRLGVELNRRIEFMLSQGGKNMHTYFMWFTNKYFRGVDGPAMRGEIIRYLIALPVDGKNQQNVDARIQMLHLLVTTCPPGADQQFLKLCLFIDWFGCDPAINANFVNVEIPMSVIRYAMFLQPPAPGIASVVQASHCHHFANSLLEYICKSVDVLIPVAAEQIRKNVNTAMRVCRDRFQHGLTQILENHKVDKRVTEVMRTVWPEFVRSTGLPPLTPTSSTSQKTTKKNPQDPKKSALRSQTPPLKKEKKEKIDKEKEKEKEKQEKLKKEKEEKEESELTSSIKLLKGEVKEKMEELKKEWKEMDDNDKCEAVEVALNLMLKCDDSFDDAQQELAAQCLYAIMGPIVAGENSILPENETELEGVFTHPIYSFFKVLISPPNNDNDDASVVMTNMMVAMREKDATLSYLLLFFIKGTNIRPKEGIECYCEVARVIDEETEDMLAADLQLCAVNDSRLFAYLVPYVFSQFAEEVIQSPELMETLCTNLDSSQLRALVSLVIREEIKLFRKDAFGKMVLASVDWPTVPQWVFWHLVHADGVPIEWFMSAIPKFEANKHDEAIANILLMLKRMDREPWAGLIRAFFNRLPSEKDSFTADALKVLIEDSEQCQRVAEIVGNVMKKLLTNGDIMGLGVRVPKKGNPLKLTLEQVIEHLAFFSTSCVQKKQRATETFMAKSQMQDAFANIRTSKNEKCHTLMKKYSNLFATMDIIAQDSLGSSRTLRGNRQGSAAEKANKRKNNDEEEHSNNKKRKAKDLVDLSDDSDSD